MGLGPIPAIQALLKETGIKIDDVDIVEINEAFAAQIVPCKEELGIPDDKLNPFGGAIALGHPFGMTGARIMTTLLNGLTARRRDLRDRVDVRRRRHGPGDARRAAQLNQFFDRVPAPGLVLVGIASVQVGAAFATKLFVHLGPAGTVLVRVLFAAIVLWAIWRPRPRAARATRAAAGGAVRARARVHEPDVLRGA